MNGTCSRIEIVALAMTLFLHAVLTASVVRGQGDAESRSADRDVRVARALEQGFAKGAGSAAHVRARWRAIRSAEKAVGASVLEARVRAYQTLDRELLPLRARFMTGFEPEHLGEKLRFRARLDEGDEMQAALLRQIESGPPSLADACLTALHRLTRSDEMPLSLALMLAQKSKGFAEVSELRRALRRSSQPAAVICYLRLLRDLGRRARVFRVWILKQVEHDSASVRLVALRTIRATKLQGAADAIVARIAAEKGRLRVEVFEALEELLGDRLPRTAAAWRKYLARVREGEKRARGEGTVAAEPLRKARGGDFFTIAQDGESVLYILDKSGSMSRAMSAKSRVKRIQLAKRELLRALDSLRADTRAQLSVFSTEVEYWKHDLRSFDRSRLREVKRWVKRIDAGGSTNTYRALADAFRLAGSRGTDRFDELELETIYLLSDGVPTTVQAKTRTGYAVDSTERILAAVRRWNPIGRVRLHTVSMGEAESVPEARGFMKALAEQNAGRAVIGR